MEPHGALSRQLSSLASRTGGGVIRSARMGHVRLRLDAGPSGARISMTSRKVTIALIQTLHGLESREFLDRARKAVEAAAKDGAEWIAFPETVLPGYPAWLDCCRDVALWDHEPVKKVFRRYFEQSLTVPGPETEELARLAARTQTTLVIGVSERVDRGPGTRTLFNSLLIFGPDGRLLNHHRKLMPTYTERMVWGPGDARGLRAVDTPRGRVGGAICWEHWMPLTRQALHESGEDLHVAAWPMVKAQNLLCSRHYAIEGRCFVAAVGGLWRREQVPPELELHETTSGREWLLRGGSCIIGPDGELLTEPVFDQEATVMGTLDLARIAEEAMTFDASGHYHRPDCLRLERPDPRFRPEESS